MANRITESQLVLPALLLMAEPQRNGIITTHDLIDNLTKILHPSGIDAEILAGRSDTYFSQKVRNLKSHNTLQDRNLADNVNGGFKITPQGLAYLHSHKEAIDYLLTEDFQYEDIKNALSSLDVPVKSKVIPICEIVEEGKQGLRNVKYYERSRKLRSIAVEHFTHNGIIECDCCGFDFKDYYGVKYESCIEIHHIRPIFQYDEDATQKTIEQALKNLMPVCPNCHRVIHRNHIGSSDIEKFKLDIAEQKIIV